MLSSKEISRREVLRQLGKLDKASETVESFLARKKAIQQLRASNRGMWYRTKYGMQFRESEFK